MGSSAAVAVAVARALFAYYEKELTDSELWDIVQSSEKLLTAIPRVLMRRPPAASPRLLYQAPAHRTF